MLDWLELPNQGRKTNGEEALGEEVRRLRPADELMVSAERLYYEGQFALAAREFHRARRHDPARFRAWAEEVDALLRAGQLEAADAVADEAMEAYGQVPVFYAAKAVVLAHQGHIERAYHHSDIAVKHQDASFLTWLSRAEVLLASAAPGILRSVEACFEKAAAHDPPRWRVAFRSALILLQWGYVDRALERLGQTIERVPDYPFALKLMGDCHRMRGEDAAARECYQTVLAKHPDHRPALEALRAMTFWGRLRSRLASLFGPRTSP
ncbi:MAG: tetratricopeptide repeat protein [Candidatus Brocadiia bacterium]